MKAAIFKVEPIEGKNFSINTEVVITEDDGTVVYKGQMAFFSTDGTVEGAEQEIKTGLMNKYLQIKNEQKAVLKDVAQNLVNKEIKL